MITINQAKIDAKEKEKNNALIYAQIAKLETKQHRSVREFISGDTTAQQRLKELDAQIAVLRCNLK